MYIWDIGDKNHFVNWLLSQADSDIGNTYYEIKNATMKMATIFIARIIICTAG